MARSGGDSIGIILAVLLGAVVFANGDPVIYDVTLRCAMDEPWCAEVYIYEIDNKWFHDPWVYGRVCTHDRKHTFKFDALFPNGDGLFFEHEYETKIMIYHNCTPIHFKGTEEDYAMLWNEPFFVLDNYELPLLQKCDCITNMKYKIIQTEELTRISEEYELVLSPSPAYWDHNCEYPETFYQPHINEPKFPKKYKGSICEWYSENYNKTEIYYWIDHSTDRREA